MAKIVIDEMGELDVGSDHCWLWMDLNVRVKTSTQSQRRMKWNISKQTDWGLFRDTLARKLEIKKKALSSEAGGIENDGRVIMDFFSLIDQD